MNAENDGAPEGATPTRRPSRRAVAVIGAAVALAVAVTLVVLQPWRSDGDESPGGTVTPAPVASPEESGDASADATADDAGDGDGAAAADGDAAAGTGETDGADPAVVPVAPELEPAAPDQTVQAPDGVTVRLAQVEHVEGEAVAAGETSGPAVRLTVEVTNGTDAPLDLSYAVVNAYTGEDRAPAGRLVQPGGRPFEGELAPGESGTGVVLFSIPDADRDDVTVAVEYAPGTSTVVFRGDLS
ncbi:hypothetical protein SAMN05518682_3521 [Cellulosimicrobium aquatile]|jgi:hypothetical protein|uniref:DUF4352 domain-containing protein n=3 Tax=Cellulosimicrobium TaxID=157920 RepID=A0A4Y8QZ08_9MICO|nr:MULTISPECIES: hypothetical protein [Cellulosimicrobium]QUB99923.1 hypothetical protein J5A69_01000 [Cellulosimicrobium cellulans]TFF06642.1 hypothetical protein E1O70_15965 [Cellulosimicrobium funkei]TGA70696.1 hypothetical protein EQW79_015180 [Cellulosimicrobium terreum]SIQ74813.1 hypothetical protein SAMN05518682_3521 [Cellulosimicrobium aquatile]